MRMFAAAFAVLALAACVEDATGPQPEAVDTACPCTKEWRNHGEYVACVVKAVDALRKAGKLTDSEGGAIVAAAAQKGCGSCGGPAVGTFVLSAPLTVLRTAPAQELLADGRVLVAGGLSAGTTQPGSEIYDLVSNSWTPSGALAFERHSTAWARLGDGRVLLVGGLTDTTDQVPNADLYDPATGKFTAAASLGQGRILHTATPLDDGTVLFTGGYATSTNAGVTLPNDERILSSAELYDPATGKFTEVGPMVERRSRHTAVKLADGRVLVSGGYQIPDAETAGAEIYDPAKKTFAKTGSMTTARRRHTMTLLPGGKVLVAGGNDINNPIATVELYDPAAGTFAPAASMSSPRELHSATLLPNGQVLVAGGSIDKTTFTASAELYDAATGTWKATGSMNVAREYHTVSLIAGGQVLVVAGHNTSGWLMSTEIYQPTCKP